MDKNIKTNDGIDISKCKVSRKSITGRINKASLMQDALIAVGVGAIAILGVSFYQYNQNDREMSKYEYSSNYESYSEQIESVLNVDLSSNLEENLNSMEGMRKAVDDYNSDNALISKADALKVLIDGKNDFETSALGIAKNWCANEWGGSADDYRIVLEDSAAPVWLAVKNNDGNHELGGDVKDLVEYIGQLQDYNKEMLDSLVNPEDFVNMCDRIACMSGKVATKLSKSNTK